MNAPPVAGLVYASILLGCLIGAGVMVAVWEALERKYKRRR
jgi:hypothetical protein